MDEKITLLAKLVGTNANYYYTGIGLKKYIQKTVFNPSHFFGSNPAWISGRWSAYAHMDLLYSVINLLDKFNIQSGHKILVHPLTPPSIVEVLIKRGCEIYTLDIDKQNLEISFNGLKSLIGNKEVNLVLFYNINGLYQEIIRSLQFLEENIIPSIIVAESTEINFGFLDAVNQLRLGAIVYKERENLVYDTLKQYLPKDTTYKPIYISCVIEQGTKGLLEYHLKNSENEYKNIIEAWFYALLKNGVGHGLRDKLTNWGYVKLYLDSKKYISLEAAGEKISKLYNNLDSLAIPDIFFETTKINYSININSEESYKKSRDLYQLISSEVGHRKLGTLEVPRLNTSVDYSIYFFYSTEKEYWIKYLDSLGYSVLNSINIHPRIRQILPSILFIEKYIILVEL